jgi:NAD(P)-dependent dehydrogenase (short-subunit alcohol dehydrogenase family)
LNKKPILLITGASKGIGASLAIAASKKFRIALNYKSDTPGINEIAKNITSKGGTAFVYQADVSNENQTKKMFEKIYDDLGPVSHLVNNAAILGKRSDFLSISNKRIEKIFATNIYGVINCTRYAVLHMKEYPNEKDKCIVNISSGAAKNGAPNQYIDYAISKGAVETLTIGLSKELAPFNIRVNAVRPGFIDTDIHENKEQRFKEVLNRIPLKRVGKPAEVANGILWLLSEKASYVTGSFLDITGGK